MRVRSADMRVRSAEMRTFWGRLRASDPGLMASAVAFNVFLALVPAAFSFLTAASFIGQSQRSLRRTETTLERFVPEAVVEFVVDLLSDVAELVDGQQGWVIVAGALIALFTGSRGVLALQKTLARIEGMPEDRSRVRVRLIGMGLTVAAGFSLILVSATLVVGGRVVDFLAELTGWSALDTVWELARFPVAAGGLFLFLLAVYTWGPPRPLPEPWLAAMVASVASILASLLLGAAFSRLGDLGPTFGVLGALAVLLVWLYVGAYVILAAGALVAHLWRQRVERLAGLVAADLEASVPGDGEPAPAVSDGGEPAIGSPE